jgi:hypothetical protein
MDTNIGFETFLKLQNSFNLNICKEIFGENYLHFWDKWKSSQNNIIYFLNRLDDFNKQKLFDYMSEK